MKTTCSNNYKKSYVCLICFKKTSGITSKTCSNECSQILRKNTCLEKYGVENISQLSIIKKKKIDTCHKNNGTSHPFQSDKIREKSKKTSIRKYGVDHPTKLKQTQEKKIQTCLEKYNVKFTSSLPSTKLKKIQTCLERHGVEHPLQSKDIMDKFKETCLERHGVEHPLQSKDIMDKFKETCLERHGVEHHSQSEEIKEKTKKTCLEKYGVEHHSQSEEIKEKTKKTCLEKYGVENSSQSHISQKTLEILKNKNRLEQHYIECGFNQVVLANKLEISNSSVGKILYRQNIQIHKFKSSGETRVLKFIQSITQEEILTNDRTTIKPLELDIFIPSLRLAIEFNGCYWHSSVFKDRKYHYNKWRLCNEQNIQLIQICESDWLHKQDIIKSIISSKLAVYDKTIYARKCEIRVVSYKESYNFLQENHLQGNCVSKIRYGLYYENELVSLMTFGKSRFKKDTIELIRFCNKLNTKVIGGPQRLFKYFTTNNEYKRLVSYSDCDYFDGKMYQKLGFIDCRHTGHSLWFVDLLTLEKHNRFKYMKHNCNDMTNIVEYYGSGNLEWRMVVI